MGATCRLLLTASPTNSPLRHASCSRCSGFPCAFSEASCCDPQGAGEQQGCPHVPCPRLDGAALNESRRIMLPLFLGITRSGNSSCVSVTGNLIYWTWFPKKKMGGEKHYCRAELDEIIAVERNNFRVGSGRGESSTLIPVCLS